MQEGEREWHPLDGREMQLTDPEQPRRREREHGAGENGGVAAHAQANRQQIGTQSAQDHRQERDDVHGQ